MAVRESGRALVVDDDERVRGVCRRILEELGLAVEIAGSAKEAWERMLGNRFDFVLTDINMADPRAELTRPRRSEPLARTDVVMMTGQPGSKRHPS